MRDVVYHKRYGKWNNKINLIQYKNIFNNSELPNFDLIIIGTPPKSHFKLLIKIIEKLSFKKLMIEKPFTIYREKINYGLLNKIIKNKFFFVGYNHSVGDGFKYFSKLLKKIKSSSINHININWKEGWTGILNAHFWLKDEFSSYLGNMNNGGGCLHEHSHGIHFLVCIEKILKIDLKNKPHSFINIKRKNKKIYYDNFINLNWKLKNFSVNYTSDLISEPADKSLKIFTDKKFELIINDRKKYDTIKIFNYKTSISVLKDLGKREPLTLKMKLKRFLK